MSNILNIIHLSERLDRMNLLLPELKKQGITEYTFWEGIENRHNRKKGIHEAHRQIVQSAKDKGDKYCIIGEDDIFFFAEGAWDYFIDNIPESFDLYFSMIMVGKIDENNRIQSVISGMSLYIVSEKFYDVFLTLPLDSHIDREVSSLFYMYDFYVCPKFVVSQHGGRSDNSLLYTESYEPLLKGRKLFGI